MRKLILPLMLLLPQPASARVPDWWRRVGWSEADAERSDGAEMARLAVRGAVKLRLQALAGDVEVVPGGDKQVTVKLLEGDGTRVSFREEGVDRVELLFDGVPALRCGHLCVEVPRQSAVDVTSASGNVALSGVGGDVRVRSTSGEVHIAGAAAAEVRSVSGSVAVAGAGGEVRVETVSGDVSVATLGTGARVAASTTSGDVHWSGSCGSGCRLEARTLSGDVALTVGDKSSFALRFQTHGGEVSDDLKLTVAGPRREGNLMARYGAGDGLIEAQTFSGDLHVSRRQR
jgi:hypothetical protein